MRGGLRVITLSPSLLGVPDSVLRRKAAAVDFAQWPFHLLRELSSAMYIVQLRLGGGGIAAPQVGVSVRLVVIDDRKPTSMRPKALVLANPMIVERSDKDEWLDEGCLSLPGYSARVERARRVRVRAQDLQGRPMELDAEGPRAQLLQHEIDHLDGVLYPDRLRAVDELRPIGPRSISPREIGARLRSAWARRVAAALQSRS
jgi:peptide deformylase